MLTGTVLCAILAFRLTKDAMLGRAPHCDGRPRTPLRTESTTRTSPQLERTPGKSRRDPEQYIQVTGQTGTLSADHRKKTRILWYYQHRLRAFMQSNKPRTLDPWLAWIPRTTNHPGAEGQRREVYSRKEELSWCKAVLMYDDANMPDDGAFIEPIYRRRHCPWLQVSLISLSLSATWLVLSVTFSVALPSKTTI